LKSLLKAKKYADLAFTAYSELVVQYSQDSNYLALLSDSQLLQAKVLASVGQRELAVLQCQQVRNRLADIAKINRDPKYSMPFARALDCLGQLETQLDLVSMLQQNGIVNFHF
jgi:hypothetical protein